jgi:hypothetical protein
VFSIVDRVTTTSLARVADVGVSANTTHTLSAASFSTNVSAIGRAKEAAEKKESKKVR